MAEFTKVAQLSELQAGVGKLVETNGKEVALFNVSGKVYAVTNVCPHQGGPLSEGTIEDNTVVCPWHGWTFDVTNGVSPVNPRAKITTYEVKVEGNDVFVNV